MPHNDPKVEIQNVDRLQAKTKAKKSWFKDLSLKEFGLLIIVACALSLLLSRLSHAHQTTTGFLGNLAAESLLIGIGFMVAAWAAKRKLAEVAPSIVEFIAQLRVDGTIKKHGARKAVVCAVMLISEDGLGEMRSDQIPSVNTTCLVCELPVNTADRCPHCHLSKATWESEALERINAVE